MWILIETYLLNYFHEDTTGSFCIILLTYKQTDRQMNRHEFNASLVEVKTGIPVNVCLKKSLYAYRFCTYQYHIDMVVLKSTNARQKFYIYGQIDSHIIFQMLISNRKSLLYADDKVADI